MILSIFRGMTEPRDQTKRAPHIFTITDTPRLPREFWDRFRAVAAARKQPTIDALRRALELYIEQEPTP